MASTKYVCVRYFAARVVGHFLAYRSEAHTQKRLRYHGMVPLCSSKKIALKSGLEVEDALLPSLILAIAWSCDLLARRHCAELPVSIYRTRRTLSALIPQWYIPLSFF